MSEPTKTKYAVCSKCGFWNKGCLTEIIGTSCPIAAKIHKHRTCAAVTNHGNVYNHPVILRPQHRSGM